MLTQPPPLAILPKRMPIWVAPTLEARCGAKFTNDRAIILAISSALHGASDRDPPTITDWGFVGDDRLYLSLLWRGVTPDVTGVLALAACLRSQADIVQATCEHGRAAATVVFSCPAILRHTRN